MSVEDIGVAEAKRRFSELTDRVVHGESFVVSRRGKAVLALVPADAAQATDRRRRTGFAALAGALAEWETVKDDMASVVRSRAKDRPRPAPELD
jgi:prevent-host-death family protein